MSDLSETEEEEQGESSETDAPGDMPLFKDMPARHVKGSRRTILAIIMIAILLPLVVGGLFYLLRSLQSPGY